MSVRARSVYPRWWERLRAVVGLAGLTVVFALLVTLVIAIVIGVSALLLEFAVTR